MPTTRLTVNAIHSARRARLIRTAPTRKRTQRRPLPKSTYQPGYMLYSMVDGEYWSQPTDGTPSKRLHDDNDGFLDWVRERRRS